MSAAEETRLEAYIVLSLLTGLRTEEVRALRWDHVVAWAGGQWQSVSDAGFDHEQLAVFVWRTDRAGGDTKHTHQSMARPITSDASVRGPNPKEAKSGSRAHRRWGATRNPSILFTSELLKCDA
jgi:integrase